MQELEEFKAKVRFLVQNTGDEVTKAAFAGSQQTINSSLTPLMIKGSISNIRMRPWVKPDLEEDLNMAVASCRIGDNKAIKEAIKNISEGNK